MKKILSILAAIFIFSSSTAFSMQLYWDVPKHETKHLYDLNNYNYMMGTKIFQGYPDGSFRPYKTISREEAASIISEYLGWEFGLYPKDTGFRQFYDVSNERWSNWHIGKLASVGIINGYPDGSYNPTGEVTRAEFMSMLYRTYRFLDPYFELEKFSHSCAHYSDVDKYHWAGTYIYAITNLMYYENTYGNIEAGVSNGRFYPDVPITRYDAANMMTRFVSYNSVRKHFNSNFRQYYNSNLYGTDMTSILPN